MTRPRLRALLGLIMLVAAAAGITLPAYADTTCAMGGPTPGARALRLDLPQGTDFIDVRLSGVRTTRPVSDGSDWHLVQGVYVLDATTNALVAYRIANSGSAPRTALVRSGDTEFLRQGVTTPDAPFTHAAGPPVTSLPPGSYTIVGFGSDGGSGLPNESWGAAVKVSGAHTCVIAGTASVFDHDHTQFQGGAEVAGYGAAYADGATLAFAEPATVSLVVGVIDSSVQLAGSAVTDYVTPSGNGSVSDRIVPFVSTAGDYSFTTHFQGLFPVVDVAGAAVTLSP